MDLDWREVQRLLTAPPLHPIGVSTVAFDTNQELLWVGNAEGRITSFCGTELQRYTSYRGHDASVRQIQFNDRGVISLSSNSVHFSNRRGLCQFDLKDDKMKDLTGMTFGNRGTSEVIAGGLQDKLLRINLDRGTVVNEVPWSMEEKILVMKRSQRYICCGTEKGSVSLLDMSSLQVIKKLPAHHGAIADIDTQNNVLLTCGYSPRPHNLGHLDPLVQVFDLRTFRPLPPIPFHAGAKFVRMHPKMANTAIVISVSGQFHVVDIANPAAVTLYHAQTSPYGLKAIDLAPSGDALAFADAEAIVRIWGSPEKIRFSEFSAPVEWPDITVPPTPMDVNDMDTPLSSVGMPYYRETLLSSWPSHMVFNLARPPTKIDPDILSTIKPGGYVPFPKRTRRYQIDANGDSNSKLTAPQFLSEKKKNEQRASDDFEAEFSEDRSRRRLFDIPKMYRKLEIKYSKFGVDDFDFEYFNKTKYSGLETHITNSYSNSLLQLYKYTAIFRNLALEHTATACLQEACLMCQLGFLFDMMEKANGNNCQATNFLRTFSSLPSAHTLGLLEEEIAPGNHSFARMIEALNRFLLDKCSTDFKSFQESTSQPGVEEALGTSSTTHIRCVACGTETSRKNMTFTTDFYYNKRTPQKKMPLQEFSTILKQSVGRENQTRGWCDKCHRYQSLVARKSVQRIPKVLMINANANNLESKMFWAKPGWLPTEVGISIEGGQFMCIQGDKLNNAANAGKYTIYELVGFVAEIKDDDERNSHLVSFIDVNKCKPDQKEPSWHVFNDFLVNSVPPKEALDFVPTWKTPTVLCFQVKSPTNAFSDTWRSHLDTDILYQDLSESHRPHNPSFTPSPKPYTILSRSEAPHTGSLVALDAEFISLQREEIEVRADGSRAVIRPSRLGLARVSVLRGEGEHEGAPFIDDYIITREPVVDYLTDYSGIHPGDLEVGRSTKALVPLKVAYKKLWILLNLGCIFVGHGLVKDFRTINIHIPQAQVLDTVHLFTLKNSFRKLSLRFLAYTLLREKIQTMSHDSIEDARTALKLYRKWLEYTDAGVLEEVLHRIYVEGREMGFKVPTALCAGVGGKAVEG